MTKAVATSALQDVLERAEKLAPEDREILMEVLQRRATAAERARILRDVAEARAAYRRGKGKRGTVSDLAKELSE